MINACAPATLARWRRFCRRLSTAIRARSQAALASVHPSGSGRSCSFIKGLGVVSAIAALFVAGATAPVTAGTGDVAIVQDIALSGNSNASRIEISLSRPAEATAFMLARPYRLILDATNVAFQLPPGAGAKSGGIVRGFRFGMLAPGRSRIVFDLAKPVRMLQDRASALKSSRGGRIVLNLKAITPEAFASRPPGRVQIGLRSTVHAKLKPAAKPQADTRPVIVVDAGHGGADPGAISSSGLREKDVVLSVAKKLVAELRKTKAFQIVTTRADDRFVSLDDRNKLSAEVGADLFVSLHADSVGNRRTAALVRGATVYTLSERASDANAKALADKENAADLAGGLAVASRDHRDDVRSILFDLIRRETANEAAQFRETLIRTLSKQISISRSPRRSAAFRVLKQLSTPAVLVELGYMSNPQDQRLMRTRAWQTNVAGAIAAAIRRHFR